ncbi:NACHT domain-containing protein [Kordia algicida OT-1]|uniref:Predicted signal transduction protein containing Nacht domain n=1 Tax=Kordia algicida OT-1 TaxID=391587 RepID=A9DP80_9FLAO|nr:NACHT domain-containing protein [Kordia algicida]EDP97373.1 Predicted signal transduction protein containing Nacht domain [Kordia algicida OT-1]
MIKETIIKESVSLISAIVSNRFKKIKIKSDKKEIEKSINNHIRYVKNWSNEITFKDLKNSKQTSRIFIPLDLYIYPKRVRIVEEEKITVIPFLQALEREKNHLAILGQPGAGKTTSMKHLCQSIFFDENFFPNRFKYPILVKLREFNKNRSKDSSGIIIEYLFGVLGLKISDDDNKIIQTAEDLNRVKSNLVIEILEKLNVLLIIDGFDELHFKSHKEIILDEVTNIASKLENSKLILTSRTADFSYSNESISVYEICPLNEIQIQNFAKKWLGVISAKKFLEEVRESPYNDTSIRPLTIAHLCAIYERLGKIPDKPKTVYKKIVNLLLEEWDEQRRIKRSSKYAMFEIDRKFEFLSNLSYHLTTKNNKVIFSKKDLEIVYRVIYHDFDLDYNEAKSVINDIESHTGLFVQSGFEFYEFAHKSIQEFLTAEYLVKLPNIIGNKRLIEMLPNELAISITISSNPSLYFSELISIFIKKNVSFIFIQKFINRLILEKPDFYKNSKVGISALLLYSKYVQSEIQDKNQLALFTTDILVDSFENLIDSIFKRNSKSIILDIYNIDSEMHTVNQTQIYLLSKKGKKKGESIESDIYHKMPKYLYCRKTFVE